MTKSGQLIALLYAVTLGDVHVVLPLPEGPMILKKRRQLGETGAELFKAYAILMLSAPVMIKV